MQKIGAFVFAFLLVVALAVAEDAKPANNEALQASTGGERMARGGDKGGHHDAAPAAYPYPYPVYYPYPAVADPVYPAVAADPVYGYPAYYY